MPAEGPGGPRRPGRGRPPAGAQALVRLLLPGPLEEPVLGDLEEEFRGRAEAAGRPAAVLWYWGQLLLLRPLRLRRRHRRLEGGWDPRGAAAVRVRGEAGAGFFDSLRQDLRYGWRRLAAAPGFTAVAILSLGIGVGANSAIFSIVNAVFFQDAGIREPDRVVEIFRHAQHPYWSIRYRHYEAMRDELGDVFSDVTAYRFHQVHVEEIGRDALTPTLLVSGDYFGVMGREPAVGRAFAPDEVDTPDPPAVVILGHRLWTRHFGADPGVVGSEIHVNARPHTVVGVLPENFSGKFSGVAVDIFLPDGAAAANPGMDALTGGARLRPGVPVERARAALDALAGRINDDLPEGRSPETFTVVPETEVTVHPALDGAMKPMAALLMGVVALVLLVACTNLASFLLVRAEDRRREFAVRRAVGADRRRIGRQLLTESVLLGLVGGALALALASGTVRVVTGIRPPLPVEIRLDFPVDWRVLAFTGVVALVAGIAAGVLPAFRAGRTEVASVLRDEAGGIVGGRRKVSARGLLVGGQVAVSMVLLVAGGLFVRSLVRATEIDPGFEPDQVALVRVMPGVGEYTTAEARRLYDEILRRTRALSDVEAAAIGTRVPLELGTLRRGLRRPDEDLPPGRPWHWYQTAYVTPGYFGTLGIDHLRGRTFRPADAPDAEPVVVVNAEAARRLWPDGDPVGRTVEMSGVDGPVRVVGVVGDTKVISLGEPPTPVVYLPLAQHHRGDTWLVARARGRPGALAGTLRTAARSVDPELLVYDAMTAAEQVGLNLYLPRMGAALLGIAGGLALLLAVVGLWGVVSYTVARREREVGIRISLGAASDEVIRLMMRGGLRLVAGGVLVGGVLAWAAGGLLERFLFDVDGTDPLTFAVIIVTMVGAALLASWLPARRAAAVDPMETLRAE